MISARIHIALAVVPLAALALLWARPALSDPMKCSSQEQTCIANCKSAVRGPIAACVTACGARGSYCLKTGCWDNGVKRFCGLAKR